MGKIIACIGDEPLNADSICKLTAWTAKQTSLPVSLLHVASPHFDNKEVISELDSSIGLGSRSDLLERLNKIDEDHRNLEKQKGELLIEHAKDELNKKKITPEVILRSGTLSHTVAQLESEAELFVIGKCGKSNLKSAHLGHNLESVAQNVHKPLLVVTRKAKLPKKFSIAFDGHFNSNKAINYIIESPLLKGAECHLVTVAHDDSETKSMLSHAQQRLKQAGFNVTSKILEENSVQDAITQYNEDNDIDLLVMGAYGHSKIRTLLFGSTTTAIVLKSEIPVLLFK